MTIYTIAFPKGGTTKTTTAVELTSYLAARGSRVLAIDLDEQGTMTAWLGFNTESEIEGTAADVLKDNVPVIEAASDVPSIPGAKALVGTHELTNVNQFTVPELITTLQFALPAAAEHFDDVVIDAPPTLGGLTFSALLAADVVIAPVACEGQATDQIDRFEHLVTTRLAPRARPGLKINVLLPTRYDGRRRLDREVLELLETRFGDRIQIAPPIRESVVVKDSYVSAEPVGRYAPESNPALDYIAAFDAIVGKGA